MVTERVRRVSLAATGFVPAAAYALERIEGGISGVVRHDESMTDNGSVTTPPYRRRAKETPGGSALERAARPMAFDPLLVFTGVLVAGAVVSQLFFLLMMEF